MLKFLVDRLIARQAGTIVSIFWGPDMRGHLVSSSATRTRAYLVTVLAVLAYVFALQFTYKYQIAPYYSYQGLTYREPGLLPYAISITATVLVALVLPRRVRRVSDFLLWLTFVLGAAPSILLAQYSMTLSVSEATIMGVCIACCMVFATVVVSNVRILRLPVARLNSGIDFWVLIGVAAFAIYVYTIATTGLQVRALSLRDVYGVRDEFGSASSSAPLLGYLLPLLTNVINPAIMAKGVLGRRVVVFLVGAVGQAIIYSSTGQKSVLFYVPVAIGVGLLFRGKGRPPGSRILVAITGAASFGFVLDWLTGSRFWSSLLVRRVMVVPGALTGAYVAVFEGLPRMNFSEILPFVDSPYGDTRPVFIVGEAFFGDPDNAANVNIFGHGYLNLGYPGMFIEALIMALLLVFANAACRNLPTPVACVIFFAPGIAFSSASVFTTVLSHGFLAAIIVCAVAPANGWSGRRWFGSGSLSGGLNARV